MRRQLSTLTCPIEMEDLEQVNWMKALYIKCNERNDGGQDNKISH